MIYASTLFGYCFSLVPSTAPLPPVSLFMLVRLRSRMPAQVELALILSCGSPNRAAVCVCVCVLHPWQPTRLI